MKHSSVFVIYFLKDNLEGNYGTPYGSKFVYFKMCIHTSLFKRVLLIKMFKILFLFDSF